jgi:hypothetical protein
MTDALSHLMTALGDRYTVELLYRITLAITDIVSSRASHFGVSRDGTAAGWTAPIPLHILERPNCCAFWIRAYGLEPINEPEQPKCPRSGCDDARDR